MKILWIDTETTGLDPSVDEIIELAGILEIEKQIKECFIFRCRPSTPSIVEQEALSVQGRTLEEVMSWPEPESLFDSFINTISPYIDKYNKNDKLIVGGHNVGFDIDMLASTAKRQKFDYLFSYLDYHKIDTMSMAMIAKLIGKINPPTLKLEGLADYLQIDKSAVGKTHNAYTDIYITRLVAQKLLRIIAGK